MRSEKIGDCGCRLERHSGGLIMVDCPLHNAAPELLEALETCLPCLEDLIEAAKQAGKWVSEGTAQDALEAAQVAIKKARGE